MKARRLEAIQLLDEKILQRYVFERINDSSAAREKLLPDRLKPLAREFKVLIPEYNRGSRHRADFRLLFDRGQSQNIEVEWTRSRFRSHGPGIADSHYRGGKGFLVVLQDDQESAPEWTRDLETVTINIEDFTWWFNNQARRLLDASISYHKRDHVGRSRKNWVIYIGQSGGAAKDYFNEGLPNATWAFRFTQGKNLANILSIQRGDTVIFGAKWNMLPNKARRIFPGEDWSCSHIDVFEVTNGYYCDFSKSTFEKDWDGEPETKSYMHYFDFSTDTQTPRFSSSKSSTKLRGLDLRRHDPLDEEICQAFRISNTQAGAPVELSEGAFASLRQKLG